jgi:hypothetical protein
MEQSTLKSALEIGGKVESRGRARIRKKTLKINIIGTSIIMTIQQQWHMWRIVTEANTEDKTYMCCMGAKLGLSLWGRNVD